MNDKRKNQFVIEYTLMFVARIPLQDELTRLYSQGFLTDITLSTEDGKNFEAHKILLAARSTYFHSVVPRYVYYCSFLF